MVFTLVNKKDLKFHIHGILCGTTPGISENAYKKGIKKVTFLKPINFKTLLQFNLQKLDISFMPYRGPIL